MALAPSTDLIHVGPETLAGKYLRQFWQPVYRSKDLLTGYVVPVRLLAEDLALYRSETGEPHLIDLFCAHRGARLSVGSVEGDCVRCLYHGWKYDGEGRCVEQPGEEPGFAAKIRLRSLPVTEYLGHVFAFLGKGDPPPLRRYPDFERTGILEAGPPEVWPCNYFNRMDNGCDLGHVPFTHRESISRTTKDFYLQAREVTAQETDYGVRVEGRIANRPPSYLHFHMPNTVQIRAQGRIEGSLSDASTLWADRLFTYVPVDDNNCITFVIELTHLTGADAEIYLERRRKAEQAPVEALYEVAEAVIAGKRRIKDIDGDVSTYYLFQIEDYAAQVGQGIVPERSRFHLGRVDRGLIVLYSLWERELRALAEGRPLTQWLSPSGLADMTVADGPRPTLLAAELPR